MTERNQIIVLLLNAVDAKDAALADLRARLAAAEKALAELGQNAAGGE